jgi:hypothetical protein
VAQRIFLTPEQNAFELGSMNWPDLLSIHEYRHVEQYSNFNVGLSHAMHILFARTGRLWLMLQQSLMVFEGDAFIMKRY